MPLSVETPIFFSCICKASGHRDFAAVVLQQISEIVRLAAGRALRTLKPRFVNAVLTKAKLYGFAQRVQVAKVSGSWPCETWPWVIHCLHSPHDTVFKAAVSYSLCVWDHMDL